MSIFERMKCREMDEMSLVRQSVRLDCRLSKCDLTSGVFHDEDGIPYILPAVIECRQRLLRGCLKSRYLAPEGMADFNAAATKLVFGSELVDVFYAQLVTLQAPGGTGALRLAFDFYASSLQGKRLWIGTPGWSNHQQIAVAAGMNTVNFSQGLNVNQWLNELERAQPYDAILLQAGAQNPTGVMLEARDWNKIAELCRRKQLLPILDNACQGGGKGVDKDAEGIRIMAQQCPELIVASSFSKNFTLYNERVGAVSIKTSVPIFANQAKEELRTIIRTNYSSPASFGAEIVAGILNDPILYQLWLSDLAKVRKTLAERRNIVQSLLCRESPKSTSPLYGLFLQLDLSTQAVFDLRENEGIYLLSNGRLSLAALWQKNIEEVASKINKWRF